MAIHISALLKYYKQRGVQDAILESAGNREVAVLFGNSGFGKRPDTLSYPKDILEFVKQGATSFHCSEELWSNPQQLSTGLKREELDRLRAGWDLIIDVDCPFLRISRIAADLLIQALCHHNISSVWVKFSGNHGFHIGIPFEAFPETVHGSLTARLFPEGPRRIAFYLQEMIRPHLAKKILEIADIGAIAKKLNKQPAELKKNSSFDPFSVLSIDTVLISSRHLYRMPYCFNEKSGLISVPIPSSQILSFDTSNAKPSVVRPELSFLDRSTAKRNEARQLIVQAFDFKPKEEETVQKREFEMPASAVPEQHFPPCIKCILNGLEDGRKRSVFVLTNFLTSAGWGYEQVEQLLKEWNQKNREQLREVYVVGQLRYHKTRKKNILPPNCANKMYYADIGVCKPDALCARIRNPVNYALLKARGQHNRKPQQDNGTPEDDNSKSL